MRQNRTGFTLLMCFLLSVVILTCETTNVSEDNALDEEKETVMDQEQTKKKESIALLIENAPFYYLPLEEGVRIEELEEVDRVFWAAQAYLLQGTLEEAEILLTTIETTKEMQYEVMHSLALISMRRNDWKTAELRLLNLLDMNREDPDVLTNLATVYFEMETYAEAERVFKDSLKLRRDARALEGMAMVHEQNKRYVHAEELYTESISLEPENHMLYAYRGKVNALQDMFIPAIADYTRAIEINPTYAWHYLDRGRLQAELRRFEIALEDYDDFIELRSDVFIAYLYRAQIYELLLDFELARKDYEMVLSIRNDISQAHTGYGVSSFVDGLYEQALPYLHQAYEEEDYSEYAMMIGLSYYALERTNELKDFLIPVIKKLPQTDVFYIVMNLLLDSTNILGAEQRISSIEDKVDQNKGYFYIGAFYEVLGNIRLATKFYEIVYSEDGRAIFETNIARYKVDKWDVKISR